MPQMRRFLPVPLIGAALAGVLLAGCGGSSHKAAPPTSAQCTQLNALLTAVGTAGAAKELPAAKTGFASLVTAANTASATPPSPVKKDLSSASTDINTINTWIQTQATQTELSSQATTGVAATPGSGDGIQGSEHPGQPHPQLHRIELPLYLMVRS